MKQGTEPMVPGGSSGGPTPTNPLESLLSVFGEGRMAGPGAFNPAPNQAIGMVPGEQEMTQTVTAPKQRKMSLLGQLADGFLGAYGQPGVFRAKHNQKQLIDDMEGFTEDPLGAIKKVSKTNPQAAWKMYEKYSDDNRQGDAAEETRKLSALKYQGIGLDRVAGMAGAANEQNWPKMGPLLKKYAADKGIDVEIPDQWDPDIVNMIRFGGIKPDQQYDNARADRKLDEDIEYKDSRLEDFDDNREAGDRRNADRIGAQNERSRLSREAVEGRFQTKRLDDKNKPVKGAKGGGGMKTMTVKDSQGNPRKIVFSGDGTRAMSKVGDRTVMYTVKDGKLIADKD